MLHVQNVSGGYNNDFILHNISFHVEKGEFLGIIGPNGSGKTTLVKMISRILPIAHGDIVLHGESISSYQAKTLAKKISVLPQLTSQAFNFTVKETVTLGRYAHQTGLFHTFSKEDKHIINEVMEQTGVLKYENMLINQLSGGERQRVFLAQALAQDPEVIILDEPTNHLDLAFQKELLDLIKDWTKERKLTVISIFHDLNLASLYSDRLLLLNEGRLFRYDLPEAVLKKEIIQEVYRTNVENHPHPQVPKQQIMLVPKQRERADDKPINEKYLHLDDEMIVLHAPTPLKTLSSGVTGAGMGWYETFVNRHVDKDYNVADYKGEMHDYLHVNGFTKEETVGMMTAVKLRHAAYQMLEGGNFSIFIVVTAGVGNAVDATLGKKHVVSYSQGTINTWVFVNGKLTEEAFIQSIVTATEAKTKALREANVTDKITGTIATGTSTDSILIAASQSGRTLEFAGSITELGTLIAEGVFHCTKKALAKSEADN